MTRSKWPCEQSISLSVSSLFVAFPTRDLNGSSSFLKNILTTNTKEPEIVHFSNDIKKKKIGPVFLDLFPSLENWNKYFLHNLIGNTRYFSHVFASQFCINFLPKCQIQIQLETQRQKERERCFYKDFTMTFFFFLMYLWGDNLAF